MIQKIIALFLTFSQLAVAAPRIIDGQVIRGRINETVSTVPNPIPERNLTGWTGTGTNATWAFDNSAGNKLQGFGSIKVTFGGASSNSTLISGALTTLDSMIGNCELRAKYKGADGANWRLSLTDGSGNELAKVQLTNESAYRQATLNYPCATGYKIKVYNSASTSTQFNVGDFYWGAATNIGSVASATLVGAVVVTGCASPWSTGSTSFADVGTQASCSYALIGQASAPSTNLPGIKFASLAPGDYKIEYEGGIGDNTTAKVAYYQFSDGTNTARETSSFYSSGSFTASTISQSLTYTTPQSNVTFTLKAKTDSGGNAMIYGTSAIPGVIRVYRFPTASEQVIRMGLPISPTITKLTSGTAQTYTVPNGVKYIHVRAVGAGGGGGGSGNAGWGAAAGAGGNTTFGTSLIVANGGGGGVNSGAGGTGGSASVTAPAIGTAIQGGAGGGAAYSATANAYTYAGMGAASPFGGAGGAGYLGAAGNAAIANSGSGGGGGGPMAVTGYSGAGGGAGGYVDALLPTSGGTQYTYSVGTIGSAGSAGTNGFVGGAGSTGYIEITEYYNSEVMPLIAQGVVAKDNTASYTTINTTVAPTTTYTATNNEETILGSASGGAWTLSLPAAASVKGKRYYVVQTASTANALTIDPNASETVCGQTTIKLIGQNDGIEIQSDGTNWLGLNGGCERKDRFAFSGGTYGTNPCTGSPCTMNSQSGAFVSVTRSGTGTYATTYNSTPYSSAPTVTTNCDGLSNDTRMYGTSFVVTTSGFSLNTFSLISSSAAADGSCMVMVQGPR